MGTTATVTAEELLHDPKREGRYELVRGELRERAVPNYEHRRITGRADRIVGNFIDEHRLGDFGPEGGFVFERDPDTVFVPDLSFVQADRVPPIDQQQGYPDLVPDLVIEVLSPSNTTFEMAEKVRIYLQTGVRLVWMLNPRERSVTAHTSDRIARTLYADDILDGGDVLPGFSVRVGELFG